MDIKLYSYIATGAALGACLRYELGNHLNTAWPLGTLVANLIGCFLLGGVLGVLSWVSLSTEWRYGIIVGFLGGLTTFSTLCAELLDYIEQEAWIKLSSYLFISVVLGIAGMALCRYSVKRILL